MNRNGNSNEVQAGLHKAWLKTENTGSQFSIPGGELASANSFKVEKPVEGSQKKIISGKIYWP